MYYAPIRLFCKLTLLCLKAQLRRLVRRDLAYVIRQQIFNVKATAGVYLKIGSATAEKIAVREKMKKIALIPGVKLINFNVITTGGTKRLAFLPIKDATTLRIVTINRTKQIAPLTLNANHPTTFTARTIGSAFPKIKFAMEFMTAEIYLTREVVEMSHRVIRTNSDAPTEASVSKCDGSVTVLKIVKTGLTNQPIACIQNADPAISSVKTSDVSR